MTKLPSQKLQVSLTTLLIFQQCLWRYATFEVEIVLLLLWNFEKANNVWSGMWMWQDLKVYDV